MATNVNIETGLIGVTPKYKFHDLVTVNTGDTIQDVSWTDCEYLAKFKKNSLGLMIVRPDYIYEDTAGNLARNGVTIVGVSTENTLARVTDPEVLRILLDNISHTLDGQIRLAEVASGSIGAAWFAGNTKIEVFDCPRGYSVAASAFNGCTGLKEVFIQKNVSLGNSAFNGCNHVECYHFLDTNVGSFGTTVFNGLSGSCYLYVPNEAVVNYCKVTNLGSYINRIRGHIKGWHLICADGSYKYNLRDCYDTATNISFRLEGTYVTNLSLSVDPETYEATVTVTGMLPDTDEDVELVYGFDYRNHHFSGYVPLHLKTGAAEIIEFEDPEVKRICVANWGGIYRMSLDGYEGEMTKEQAAKVSSIGTAQTGAPWKDIRSQITSFNEFRYFTQITTLPGSWAQAAGGVFQGCTRMISVQLPPNLKYVQDNSFRACTNLTSLEIPATVNTLARGCFRDMKCPVIILATTPPSLSTYDNQNTCTFYVPNESVVTYRGTSEWSSLRGKIHGFVSGPIEIMKDGQYQYKLQSYFSSATDFSLSIQDNEYLSLEFSDDTGIVTVTGITSEIEDTSVRMNYEFNYKGTQYSGSFEIALKYRETIDFEDAEVKRICVANWGGEYSSSTNKYGVPGEITMEQAAAVSSIGTTFNNNQVIEHFMELQYFTKLTSLYASSSGDAPFYNCRNLKTIKIPEGVTNCRNAFYYCSTITFIELPSTITAALDLYTFRNTSGNKKLIVHFSNPVAMMEKGTYGSAAFNFDRGIYVPDENIDKFKANTTWNKHSIYPLSEWDGTT